MKYHYHTANNFDSFKTFTLQLTGESWYKSLTSERRYILDLILEEMISNIIKYAYDDDMSHNIEVIIAVESGVIELMIIDDGHEFNPDKEVTADLKTPLSERRIGGVGILLTKSMSREMNYCRVKDKNILRIVI